MGDDLLSAMQERFSELSEEQLNHTKARDESMTLLRQFSQDLIEALLKDPRQHLAGCNHPGPGVSMARALFE